MVGRSPRLIGLIVCVAATFAFAAEATVAGIARGALWQVIQACLVNHSLTGADFPCLEVSRSGADDAGFVILRPPLMSSDLILSPTRRIAGVEDPSLAALDAPNYFEDAWSARKYLKVDLHRPIARDDVVLAVNSRQSRTQDQLHIHIGCLTRRAKLALHDVAPKLSEAHWSPLGRPFQGLEFWGRLLAENDLAGVNPFRLAAEAWPSQYKDKSQLTLAAAGIQLADGRDGFVLLASYNNPLGQFSAEDFLDFSAARCR